MVETALQARATRGVRASPQRRIADHVCRVRWQLIEDLEPLAAEEEARRAVWERGIAYLVITYPSTW